MSELPRIEDYITALESDDVEAQDRWLKLAEECLPCKLDRDLKKVLDALTNIRRRRKQREKCLPR